MTPVPSWQSFTVLAVITAIAWLVARQIWQRTLTAPTNSQPHADTSPRRPAAVAGLCALALALALLIAALVTGALDTVDGNIRAGVQILYDDALVRASTFVTSLGDSGTLVAVALVAAGLLGSFGRYREIKGLAVSVMGSQLTTYTLKYAIGRERPEFESFATAVTPSFPSAHATGAAAVYGFIIYTIARRLPPRARFEAVFWGSCFVLLLAATRVIIGVHYLSDVIAGLLIGAFWLIAGRITCR